MKIKAKSGRQSTRDAYAGLRPRGPVSGLFYRGTVTCSPANFPIVRQVCAIIGPTRKLADDTYEYQIRVSKEVFDDYIRPYWGVLIWDVKLVRPKPKGGR